MPLAFSLWLQPMADTRREYSALGICASLKLGSPFHRALRSKDVARVLGERPQRLDVEAAVGARLHHADVGVLDRLVVAVEAERPAHALEVGFPQRRAQGILVLDIALHFAHCRV